MHWFEIRAALTLLVVLLMPGWGILGVTKLWNLWAPFQRWCIALGIGIAFYPVLFYISRFIPGFRIGQNKLLLLIGIFIILIIWSFRNDWKKQFEFDRSELIAVFLLIGVLVARVLMAHLYPYPAWSDSLHHTLITDLTAKNGRLPESLLPYEPVTLRMYHLGLYSLTGTLEILARIPAHTSLLITAQILNALNIIGIYVFLDRLVNRKAALVGVLVVGFLSFQPAWYFNWGRFTQVASQSVLLLAVILTMEVIGFRRSGLVNYIRLASLIAISGMVIAAVFLLHFRVSGMFLPAMGLFVLYKFAIEKKYQSFWSNFSSMIAVGVSAILFILPVLLNAMNIYISQRPGTRTVDSSANPYFDFPFESLFALGIQQWLFVLTLISIILGIIWRNKITWLVLLWVVILWVEGHLYLLGIPILAFTNYGAILIMYYIPVSLLIGVAAGELSTRFPVLFSEKYKYYILGIFLLLAFVGGLLRTSGIERYRYFMLPEDESAMKWINENTATDAVFAIDTYMWNGISPHGVDGGYWIPYFTGRKTTTGTMLYSLGEDEYVKSVQEFGFLISNSGLSSEAMVELCSMGVDYAYIGAKRDRLFGSFDPDEVILRNADRVLYAKGGVAIIQVCR